MFRYYETYTVDVIRYFDDETIKEIVEDYKNYLEKRQYEDNEISFEFFITDTFDNGFPINCSWDFDDSNIEELYNEIKKYM